MTHHYLRTAHFRTLFTLSIALSLLACASGPKSGTPADEEKKMREQEISDLERRSNQIAPGFIINVRHPEDSKIAGEYKVEFSGDILLPYNVKIKAAGLTVNELKDQITTAYNQFFTSKNPVKVDIVKKQYWVEVRGLVGKPGRYLIQRYTSLEELLSMAGGGSSDGTKSDSKTDVKAEYVKIVIPDFNQPNKSAHTRWIRLTDYFARSDQQDAVTWYGGERIFLQTAIDRGAVTTTKNSSIRIMGEVSRPGEYDIRDGEDLYLYIARAGGPTTNADLSDVKIVRKGERETDDVDLLQGRQSINLEPGDVVLVKANQQKPSGFEKGLSITATIAGIITPLLLVLILL